jgi:benzoate/toluate 1,2-dioxygenase alpha subunit
MDSGTGGSTAINLASLVDDRREDGVFRVDRRVHTDPAILEAEFVRIFEANWVFLCLEGLVPRPGDYVATHIGRQPVFVIRRNDGTLGAFLNACAHRGAILTRARAGSMTTIDCSYHGWCYDTDGRCVAITTQKVGWPGDDFDRTPFDLKRVPRLESYRGFVFGSLNPDVVPLKEHLGPITAFLDIFCAPAPRPLEVVAGASIHTMNCNWKILHDNGPDPYHAATVHRNFAITMMQRDRKLGNAGLRRTETGRLTGRVESGSYAMGNGHTAFWAAKETPEAFPIYALKDELEKELSPGRARWVLERSRHITVFPNLLVNELASTYVRTYRPLGVDRTEVSSWCVAPVGEPPKLRTARLRKFEDFFMPTGMSTPDDVAVLEITHKGNQATAAHRSDMTRGMAFAIDGPDEPARELGIRPERSTNHFQHEIALQGVYRQWARMMASEGGARRG